MAELPAPRSFVEALKIKDIRLFIGSGGSFTFASRALTVVIGFQIYKISGTALALGWLGLIEAIPAISISPFGGHIADRINRRTILLITGLISCLSTLALALISWQGGSNMLLGLYSMIFVAGVARGFADPASTAFEAQIVPKHLTFNASSWISSTWIGCSIVGPAAIGFIFDAWGAANSYLILAGCFLLSWIFILAIPSRPLPPLQKAERVFVSIITGWRFVFNNKPLLGAMALDLFAVFFGGAVILLPIYANDILHVGAKGLGLLNSAPSIGALALTLAATAKPPIARAGKNLLVAVAGFGICIIVFAFSRNFWLSMTALFLSGVFDGVSMIIRRSMVRLLSPDHLRGRVAAANWIFITASNELGAFESGIVAALIGTVPCVALGGLVTSGLVIATAIFAKQLRQLRFDPHSLDVSRAASN